VCGVENACVGSKDVCGGRERVCGVENACVGLKHVCGGSKDVCGVETRVWGSRTRGWGRNTCVGGRKRMLGGNISRVKKKHQKIPRARDAMRLEPLLLLPFSV
jgi:hypothetical protein